MGRTRGTNDRADGRRTRDAAVTAGERVRRRLTAEPELELDDEELGALADEGIDPADVRRLAREPVVGDVDEEVSAHDRDTARDHVEGLTRSGFDEL